eukprot:1143055-Heterocapsa_arctica.AAC.1
MRLETAPMGPTGIPVRTRELMCTPTMLAAPGIAVAATRRIHIARIGEPPRKESGATSSSRVSSWVLPLGLRLARFREVVAPNT